MSNPKIAIRGFRLRVALRDDGREGVRAGREVCVMAEAQYRGARGLAGDEAGGHGRRVGDGIAERVGGADGVAIDEELHAGNRLAGIGRGGDLQIKILTHEEA